MSGRWEVWQMGRKFTIEPGGSFRWNPKLGGGIKRLSMSPDVLPPRLIGEIGARPGQVGKGKVRDWGCRARISGVAR